MNKKIIAIAVLTVGLSGITAAQAEPWGPAGGEREFSLSGTGSSDKDFDNSSFGISADLGWFTSDKSVWGVRQSINFADIQGEDLSNDFWNGSTRGYYDYHFLDGNWRPFIGANLGFIYGDGVKDSGFAGPELGVKYYVLKNTFILARAEYQFFFTDSNSASDNWEDGAFAYVFGMGYNF
jgi:hypothetical protein